MNILKSLFFVKCVAFSIKKSDRLYLWDSLEKYKMLFYFVFYNNLLVLEFKAFINIIYNIITVFNFNNVYATRLYDYTHVDIKIIINKTSVWQCDIYK